MKGLIVDCTILFYLCFIFEWYHFLFQLIWTDAAAYDINLTVTDTAQYIATEGYPIRYYMNNQDCSFNFMASPGRKFIVMFEEFDLEAGYDFIHFRKL